MYGYIICVSVFKSVIKWETRSAPLGGGRSLQELCTNCLTEPFACYRHTGCDSSYGYSDLARSGLCGLRRVMNTLSYSHC